MTSGLGQAEPAPEYRPITAEEFVATDEERFEQGLDERRNVPTVDRIASVDLRGCGLHLLQPLRDIERHADELGVYDRVMAGGHHYFPTDNRYPTKKKANEPEARKREAWPASQRVWPVSVDRILQNEELHANLWDDGGHLGYRVELSFPRSTIDAFAQLLGPTSGTLPFEDWCGFTTMPGESVTDMIATIVRDGVYYKPFSIRDLVLANEAPVDVIVADGLSREEANRLLWGLQD